MRCGNKIITFILWGTLLLVLPAFAVCQEGGHLWNVTDTGDTLRYVNIFSGRAQEMESGFPRYVALGEYRNLVQSTGIPEDSIAYRVDIAHLLRSFPEERNRIQPLHPEYENIWKPVLAATVSGALSAYFKLEANAAYERYNRSIDLDDINKYYELTRKYDTYSAISFVFLQAGFGWLSYKLLR